MAANGSTRAGATRRRRNKTDAPGTGSTVGKVDPGMARPRWFELGEPRWSSGPTPELIAALRTAFPGFAPTWHWWSEVDKRFREVFRRSHPENYAGFHDVLWGWSAAELIDHMEEIGMIPRRRKTRGPSWDARVRALHNEAREFAETAPEQALADRFGVASSGCFSKCDYWRNKLQPIRRERRAKDALSRARRGHDGTIVSRATATGERRRHDEEIAELDATIDRDAEARRWDSAVDGGHRP